MKVQHNPVRRPGRPIYSKCFDVWDFGLAVRLGGLLFRNVGVCMNYSICMKKEKLITLLRHTGLEQRRNVWLTNLFQSYLALPFPPSLSSSLQSAQGCSRRAGSAKKLWCSLVQGGSRFYLSFEKTTPAHFIYNNVLLFA